MATLTVVTFFAESHRGDEFGKVRILNGRVSRHRGDDTNGWKLGTQIPSFVTGRVVASYRSGPLGWVVVVWSPLYALWFSFCHLQSQGLPVGATVSIGTAIGPLGNTGTLTTGPHVHVTASGDGPDPATDAVIDPRPYINRAKLTPAGGGTAPVPPNPTNEDDDMSKNAGVYWTAADKRIFCAILNTESGFWTEWTHGTTTDGTYNLGMANTFGTGSFAGITESHAKALRASCQVVLDAAGVDVELGDLTVQENPAELAELKSIRAAVEGLPAEIDQFADGNKQS